MKKWIAILLTLALLLCGATALAQVGEEAVVCAIEDGSYVIRIPDPSGDLGWLADDMAQDDTVVKLAGEGLEDGEYVVRYEPAGDGDVAVHVRHYTGIACDEIFGWDLRVQDGAVQECTGGSYAVSPNAADQDPYLSGEWLQAEAQYAQMSIEMNPSGRAWDVEIASPMTHGAYIFKTTIYYDCELNAFVYDKGKFWDLPVTDSDEPAELGEAAVAGTTGSFAFVGDDGDLCLEWHDDQAEYAGEDLVFARADEALAETFEIDYGASGLYDEADMNEAIALITAEFSAWEGCELHAIRYAGDECNSEENLQYMNELREGGNFAQCIEFLSDFHTPAEDSGAFEADQEYTDWQWWLARPEGGSWELLGWGY